MLPVVSCSLFALLFSYISEVQPHDGVGSSKMKSDGRYPTSYWYTPRLGKRTGEDGMASGGGLSNGDLEETVDYLLKEDTSEVGSTFDKRDRDPFFTPRPGCALLKRNVLGCNGYYDLDKVTDKRAHNPDFRPWVG